jgi:hypothetical protein
MLTGRGGKSSGTGGGLPPPEPVGGWPVPAPPGVAARIADERERSAEVEVGDRPPMPGPPLLAIRVPPADDAVLGHGGAPAPEVRVTSLVGAGAVRLLGVEAVMVRSDSLGAAPAFGAF